MPGLILSKTMKQNIWIKKAKKRKAKHFERDEIGWKKFILEGRIVNLHVMIKLWKCIKR